MVRRKRRMSKYRVLRKTRKTRRSKTMKRRIKHLLSRKRVKHLLSRKRTRVGRMRGRNTNKNRRVSHPQQKGGATEGEWKEAIRKGEWNRIFLGPEKFPLREWQKNCLINWEGNTLDISSLESHGLQFDSNGIPNAWLGMDSNLLKLVLLQPKETGGLWGNRPTFNQSMNLDPKQEAAMIKAAREKEAERQREKREIEEKNRIRIKEEEKQREIEIKNIAAWANSNNVKIGNTITIQTIKSVDFIHKSTQRHYSGSSPNRLDRGAEITGKVNKIGDKLSIKVGDEDEALFGVNTLPYLKKI